MCKAIYFLVTISLSIAILNGNPLDEDPTRLNMLNYDPNNRCDNGVNGIGVDWDGVDSEINKKFYECDKPLKEKAVNLSFPQVEKECRPVTNLSHICVSHKIHYDDPIPAGGPHRAVWPHFGEYLFLPVQRWLHGVEHGAAVFVYNPCADQEEIQAFKNLAKSCLRRHLITPSKDLPEDKLFAIVTFGCKINFSSVKGNEQEIIEYLREEAIVKAPEAHVFRHGHYRMGLIEQSKVVSDVQDSKICPNM